MDEWRQASAAELGRGIAAGGIDPEALAETFLDAIGAHPEASRIYARATPDRARAEAKAAAARARTGTRRGPLDGVPLSWKDLFDTAGIATEAGTALMKDRVPDADAAVLRTATLGGSVCLGKTHLSEIAFSGLGYNPITATPPNRHDPDAVPGGSSSGAAASVAFGLAPAAVGSDTGGSVRVPAAWADLVGFKPTHAALPLTGAVPLCTSFDTIGPLCRSVEDAGLIFALLAGRRVPDLRGGSLDGVRLAVPEALVMDDLDPSPAAAFDDAVARLEAAGATIVRLSVPMVAPAYDLAGILYSAEAWAWWRSRIEPSPGVMFSEIHERVSAGAGVSAADFVAGWDRLRELRRDWTAATGGVDAVLCPTVALMPPKVRDIAGGGDAYKAANLKTLRNTRLANLFGLPSVTLPTGTPACGLMLNGVAGSDLRLLRLAAAAERGLA
ncbi:amidase [Wenxinia marina]|uniref:Asp-tRNAAsn/Glu-tRNAGln amidotransferase A subunit n=1 Tax=Wenxinia marina DSM 24838 TaxID=1123501 RepID=A0A0D0Q9P0_9RHOB|nr:amidase family protein [Wenxinia marina]KIQ71149.1 Asp-tRNAAsn/Glu-tRNAGln amidotransferase A subunit [Wenxinia marina DSM 24838]GGL54447.1 amidase [Wenxinia marina]